MSLSARSRFNPVLRFHKCPCVLRRWPDRACVRACVKVSAAGVRLSLYTCVYTHIHTQHPLFPVCRLVEVGDPEGGPKRGGARDAGGENKLISLTQPAVTPPQHDINPKPRLSLFKLYESLCRRIGGENFVGGSLSVLLSRPHFSLSLSLDLIFPRW